MSENSENQSRTDKVNIEVVAVDGEDCVFFLAVRRNPDGSGGGIVTSSANGISREGAIAVLRDYADALESGAAPTRDT